MISKFTPDSIDSQRRAIWNCIRDLLFLIRISEIYVFPDNSPLYTCKWEDPKENWKPSWVKDLGSNHAEKSLCRPISIFIHNSEVDLLVKIQFYHELWSMIYHCTLGSIRTATQIPWQVYAVFHWEKIHIETTLLSVPLFIT